MICPVCNHKLKAGYQIWHFICQHCRYEKATLEPHINLQTAHQNIDESARRSGLQNVRISNFKKLLKLIRGIKPQGGHLLDVGCAHGWFLETAKNAFTVMGIEPDQQVFESTIKKKLPVRLGYFPTALEKEKKFDVIVFNDVIEHIPDILNILTDCHASLHQEGLLVLNLPSSQGLFYRFSKLLCRFGFAGFFERLWQKDLPSPHVHYFNISNLVTLLQKNHFHVKVKGRLSTLKLSGLYTRIKYTGDYNFLSCILIYLGIFISLPFLRMLPSDIIYIMAKKE